MKTEAEEKEALVALDWTGWTEQRKVRLERRWARPVGGARRATLCPHSQIRLRLRVPYIPSLGQWQAEADLPSLVAPAYHSPCVSDVAESG